VPVQENTMNKVKLLVPNMILLLLLLSAPALAFPSYGQEDESQGLSDFAHFKASLSGMVELTDRKMGFVDDIEIRVRVLKDVKSGASVKGVCLFIPAGEGSPLILLRYIDADELAGVLIALQEFQDRIDTTKPEPDMKAYYITRGRIGIGVKYYGKWKGIVMTDGLTRTFGSRNFSKLKKTLEAASQYL
jgi:hypothetical protein